MLEVDGVILEFGLKRVLQDIYLKVEPGKVSGILGRNGSGKSCLMKIIFGDLKAENSSVRINGKNIFVNSGLRQQISYLPQYRFVPKFLTIKRIFKDYRIDPELFLSQFPDFSKHFQSKFGMMSGGEQRIIEIYIILFSKFEYCLLDEPFSHIMPVHVDAIKRIISEEKLKKGILISDHLYEHIVDISDKLYLLSDGKTHTINNINDLENLGYIRMKQT